MSANLQVIIPVVTGVLGGLAAVIKIVLSVKGYFRDRSDSHYFDGRVAGRSTVKSGSRILELFGRKDKSFSSLKDNSLLQEIQPKSLAQKSAKIFFSYKIDAHPDDELVGLLRNALEKRGHKPFVNTMLPLGIEWAKALQRQIEGSDFLVVLLSDASLKSEMVLEEVTFAEIHRIKHRRPQLLPVRVRCLKALPYGLANHLNAKQFALWIGEEDSAELVSKIFSSIEAENADLTSEPAMLVEDDGDKAKPLPSFDPRILETPSGAVKLQSPLYIRRDCDEKIERQVLDGGSTTTIRAGRQMGKTSLLVRAANFAKERGHRIVYVDFQQIKPEFRNSLDNLLRYLADEIAFRLNLDEGQLEKVWSSSRGSPDKFGQFMESVVLPDPKPLFLAMDEADQLMDVAYKTDFFALVRAWDSRRAFDDTWGKLSLAMVISSHPHLLIDDYRQSPFNVGLRIQLEDFSVEQVGRLNRLHNNPLNDDEILEMMIMLSGHPFLTRQAFYTLVDEKMAWREFAKTVAGDRGPFSSHLHFYLWQLRERPELISGMKEVIQKQTCSDEIVLYRLVAAGLVKEQEDDTCVVRCGLYENYFRKMLNA